MLWVLQSPSVAIAVQQSWEHQYYMTVQNLIYRCRKVHLASIEMCHIQDMQQSNPSQMVLIEHKELMCIFVA